MPLTIYFGHELTEKDLIDYGFHNDLMQYKIYIYARHRST